MKNPSLPSPNYQEIYSNIRDALSKGSPEEWYTPHLATDLFPLFAKTVPVQGDYRILKKLKIGLRAARDSIISRFETKKANAQKPRRTRKVDEFENYIINWDAEAVADMVKRPESFSAEAAASVLKLMFLVIGTSIEFGISGYEGILCSIHFKDEHDFCFLLNEHDYKSPIRSIIDKRRIVIAVLRELNATYAAYGFLLSRLLNFSNQSENKLCASMFQTQHSGKNDKNISYKPYKKWTSQEGIYSGKEDLNIYDPSAEKVVEQLKNQITENAHILLKPFIENLLFFHPMEGQKDFSHIDLYESGSKGQFKDEPRRLTSKEKENLYTVIDPESVKNHAFAEMLKDVEK